MVELGWESERLDGRITGKDVWIKDLDMVSSNDDGLLFCASRR